MKLHFQQAVRAFILLAFCTLLFKLHHTGEITKLINPKYEGLSQAASILFLILFFTQVTRVWTRKEKHSHHHTCQHHDHDHHCSHDHGDTPFTSKKLLSYLIIVFPLVTGFFLPAKVLDASIVEKKGGMAVLTNKKAKENQETNNSIQENQNLTENFVEPPVLENQKEYTQEEYDQLIQQLKQSSKIEMTDEVFSTYYDEIHVELNKFKGREIKLTGFVYKEEGLAQDQLVLSRFLITHCVADASIIGFISELEEASQLEENTWVEATGTIDITDFNGMELPVIKITDWNVIKEPKEPYLYPISIKVL